MDKLNSKEFEKKVVDVGEGVLYLIMVAILIVVALKVHILAALSWFILSALAGCYATRKKRSVLVFSAIGFVVSPIIGIAGILAYQSTKPKPSELFIEKFNDRYPERLQAAFEELVRESDNSIKLCATHRKAWRKATKSEYTSIDVAIRNSMSQNSSYIQELLKGEDRLESMMVELSSPPNELEEAHKSLKIIYSKYRSLVSLATSPTGSLLSYTAKVDRIGDELLEEAHKFKVSKRR